VFPMADNFLYFTELVGMPVLDLKGRRIGRVKDAAIVPVVNESRVDRVMVGGAYSWLTVRFDQIRAIQSRFIQLSDEQLTPYHDDEYLLRIGRDLLDQQIVDVTGHKVVRVTALTFEIRNDGARDTLNVREVDVGIRSIVRRLLQGILPGRWIRRLLQRIPPKSIRWEFCNIVEADPQRRLRLNISHGMLEKMHPADLSPARFRNHLIPGKHHPKRIELFQHAHIACGARGLELGDNLCQPSARGIDIVPQHMQSPLRHIQ